MMKKLVSILFFLVLLVVLTVNCAGIKTSILGESEVDMKRLEELDTIIPQEMEKGKIPGVVVCVGSKEKIYFEKAFGYAGIEPEKVPMKIDTIFDLASVTKPVGTATSIMILVDRGKLGLDDKVSKYIPEFASKGKENATIKNLLTHSSGLPAYMSAKNLQDKYGCPCPDAMIKEIANLEAKYEPGKDYIYSCLGFITLSEIVKIVSGQDLDTFSRENLFKPLGMKETMYLLPDDLKKRCIVTTKREDGKWIQGEVHDPLAYLRGGISGNAGLFSTDDDIVKFARMMLNYGEYKGVRILKRETVELMTSDVTGKGRGLGWCKGSVLPYLKQDLSDNSYGHTGYTGTSIWIDPINDIFVILFTNRVHPDDKSDAKDIRNAVSKAVSSAIVKK